MSRKYNRIIDHVSMEVPIKSLVITISLIIVKNLVMTGAYLNYEISQLKLLKPSH